MAVALQTVLAAAHRVRLTTKERDNRETWLNRGMHLLRPAFKAAGIPLHNEIRISVGFPLGGFEKIDAQCFKRDVSSDRHNEIFISPLVDDAAEALGCLAHELIHAQDNGSSGHDRTFAARATTLGLEGKPTQCGSGTAFKRRYADMLRTLGPYPHKSLRPTKIKRQGTRLVKVACPECEYTVRVTRKWLDAAGAPICPTDEVPFEEAE